VTGVQTCALPISHTSLGISQQFETDGFRVLNGVLEVDKGVSTMIAQGALGANSHRTHVTKQT
jgi:hypothetical protein